MMMSIGIGRLMLIVGGLWVIADEREDEGGRRPGQQGDYEGYEKRIRWRIKIAMSGLDQPTNQTKRELQVLSRRQRRLSVKQEV